MTYKEWEKNTLIHKFKEVEKKYCLAGLTPQEKAECIIKRVKGGQNLSGYLAEVINVWTVLYLFSCDLTKEQRKFALWVAFGDKEFFSYLDENMRKFMVNCLRSWWILDYLKCYEADEKSGQYNFARENIPMEYVNNIINSPLFKTIIKEGDCANLCWLPVCREQQTVANSINDTGRISASQYKDYIQQAIECLQAGDYNKEHYLLLKGMGPEQKRRGGKICDEELQLANLLDEQILKINTRLDLINYFELRRDLGWIDKQYSFWINGIERERCAHMLKLLGVEDCETNLANFNLKKTEDNKLARHLFYLVFDYPFLFRQWYPRSKDGLSYARDVNSCPLFIPAYGENGLAMMRLKLNYTLASKGGFGAWVANIIAPKQLSPKLRNMEQEVSDRLYGRQPGIYTLKSR